MISSKIKSVVKGTLFDYWNCDCTMIHICNLLIINPIKSIILHIVKCFRIMEVAGTTEETREISHDDNLSDESKFEYLNFYYNIEIKQDNVKLDLHYLSLSGESDVF